MFATFLNPAPEFLGGDGEWGRIIRLDGVEAFVGEAISADQDRGQANLDRLGDMIDGFAQVLSGDIRYAGVSAANQNSMNGRQRLVHERDGGYARENRECGWLLVGGWGARGGGGGRFWRRHCERRWWWSREKRMRWDEILGERGISWNRNRFIIGFEL